jgi:hypothetical protein
MKTIHKYKITLQERRIYIKIPINAVPVTVTLQYGQPVIYCELPDADELATKTLAVDMVGTGDEISEGFEYLGTVMTHGDRLVWHAYIETPKQAMS